MEIVKPIDYSVWQLNQLGIVITQKENLIIVFLL